VSTWVYFACLDHDPPIRADSESGQHNEFAAMRALLASREAVLAGVAALGPWVSIETGDRYKDNGLAFFAQHPRCRLACVDEYDRWTDLGHGVPDGARLNERNLQQGKEKGDA
jgi:hypothetical protein